MKKIIVSDDCVACGACIILSELLIEKPNGKVDAVEPKIISDEDAEGFKTIINECPVKAISLEEGLVKKEAEGIQEFKNITLKNLKDINIKYPNSSDLNFNEEKYCLSIPKTSYKSRFSFTSDSKAQKAGLQEFDKVMYSQRKALIQDILVQYKNIVLKKYFIYEEKEGNYYFEINGFIKNLLKELELQAKELTNYKIKLPNDFKKFDILPDSGLNDIYSYRMRNIENYFIDEIMNELESLSWYETFINTEDRELSSRYIYCFDIEEAIQLFNKHILEAISYILNSERILSIVNEGIQLFIEDIKKETNVKYHNLIAEINKCI